jgi:hypothetical protein
MLITQGGGIRRTFVCPGGTKCVNYKISREVYSFRTSDKKHYKRSVKAHAKRCVATEQKLEELLNAEWAQYVRSDRNPNQPQREWENTNPRMPSLKVTSDGLFHGIVSTDMTFVEMYTLLQPDFQEWFDAQVGLIDFMNSLEEHSDVMNMLLNFQQIFETDPEAVICVDTLQRTRSKAKEAASDDDETKAGGGGGALKKAGGGGGAQKDTGDVKKGASPQEEPSSPDLFAQLFGEGIDQTDSSNKFPCPAGCRNKINVPIFCRSIGKLLTHLRDCHPKIRIGVMFSGLPKAITAFDEDDQGGIAVVQPAFGELTSDKELYILKDEEENDWEDDEEEA